MSKTAHDRKSASDKARDLAALRDAAPAFVTLLVFQGSLILLNPDGKTTGWLLLWSFSPLAPALWLMWTQLRSVRRADEYQRVLQLQAMAIGFGAVILLSFTGGLLDAAGMGDPSQSLQVTFIGGVLVWVGALAIKTRSR
ncbi:MAG TPA: hypothetical protein VIJ15_09175 [Dermatophilaceae bacterium]